jgi:hypothetical protein
LALLEPSVVRIIVLASLSPQRVGLW